METTCQESVDKIVNDHFMYEATDDIEGVLGTFTEDAEHESVGGPDGPLKEKSRFVVFTRVCSGTSKVNA